jgi:hypothetical protein
LEDAGVPPSRCDLEGAAETMWHEILREAKNMGRLSELVRVARQEYPHFKVPTG